VPGRRPLASTINRPLGGTYFDGARDEDVRSAVL
jgi:hypothetical protein